MDILTRTCPYCKEEIMAGAVKCKYCGEFINDALSSYENAPPQSRKPVAPQNYLVWAILATVFCCMPLGIISIIFSAQVDSTYARGDYAAAERASRQAWAWMLASVITFVVLVGLYIMLIVFGAMSGGFGSEFNEFFS